MIELEARSCAVTGGAGFIGSHICEQALNQGLRVVAIDNFKSGYRENVAHLASNPRFSLVEHSVTDLEAMVEAFAGVDVVFHNAASKNTVCLTEPRTDLDVNAWGAWTVAEAARRTGVGKVVHASTGSVYGEVDGGRQSEDNPKRPVSFYGVSKLAGENYLNAFANYYPGFRYSVIRYFHVYGPRQEYRPGGGVIPIFIAQVLRGEPMTIYGDGSQVRSFTYVEDDVAANFLLANSAAADGKAFNAASGIRVSVLELAKKVRDAMGSPDTPINFEGWRPGDIREFDVDVSRLRALGGDEATDFDIGLARTIEWYRNHLTA